jgi:ribonuclease Z
MRDVISRGKPSVIVIGSGEAFSSADGNTSYLLIGGNCPGVLFDCGYQIPERLWKAKLDSSVDMVFLTHLHADHVFGIVPLICRYLEDQRRKPLTIVGGRGTKAFVRRLVEMGYPGILRKLGFELNFIELSESRESRFEHFTIRVARTRHSIRNFTYRVDFKCGVTKSFAVSGDGRMTPETCSLVKNVGLLFQEVYSFRDSIPVHMDLKNLERWIPRSQIGKIGVSHHSRSELRTIERRVALLKKKDKRWFCVRPGMKIPL